MLILFTVYIATVLVMLPYTTRNLRKSHTLDLINILYTESTGYINVHNVG